MEQIRIDDGSRSYQIVNHEGKELGVFTFVPTDSNILERYEAVSAALQGLMDDVTPEGEDAAQRVAKANALLKEKMDELFGYPTDAFWTVCGPLTPLKNGETYIESVLDGIRAVIEKEMEKSNEALQKRMKSYTETYEKS